MHTPYVRKFPSGVNPWDVYKQIYSEYSNSFFLDSHEFLPPNQSFSYMGMNPYLEVIIKNGKVVLKGEINKRYPASEFSKVLRNLQKKYKSAEKKTNSFFTGGAVGYWGYEMAAFFEKVKLRKKKSSDIPKLYLGYYRDVIAYDHQKKTYYLIANIRSKTTDSIKGSKALDQLQEKFELVLQQIRASQVKPKAFSFKNFHAEISKFKFEAMVNRAKEYIRAGDIYQANLSQRFSFDFKGSPLELYEDLRKINPSPFASFLKFGHLKIVSSSPERLVRKKGRYCQTQPIAGTRPRRQRNRTEKALRTELIHNEKEKAEHVMLVDLERNDLGRVCDAASVKVEEMMTIERYSHVIHLVSKITGKMKKNHDFYDLIKAMFPGGTITGCPKIRCMEIIDELEPVGRGIYTGSIGYIDFYNDLDLNIVIRTLVLEKAKGYLQVGAGIVFDSKSNLEYEETLHKGEAMAEALVEASK